MKWQTFVQNAVILITAVIFGVLFTPQKASAWECPSGQHWVQVPSGTAGATIVEGIAFQCQSDAPNSSPSSGTQSQTQSQQQSQQQSQNTSVVNSNQNTNKNSSSSVSNSNSSAWSNSKSNSTSTATVSNSGNSSATGGSANATNNSNGNVTSYSDTYNETRQNPGAYAPSILNTSPCTKGFSGGASTPAVAAALGISTTDKGCDSRQTAVIFHGLGNDYAAAKVLCSTSAAKRAKLTLDDCERIVVPAPIPVVVPAPPVSQPPTVIVVPTPVPPAPPAPVKQETSTVIDIGSCQMRNLRLTNVCKRVLDDAALRLENAPDSKLVLIGPVEATQAVAYLSNRVSRSRIMAQFSDDQNETLNLELFEMN